MAAERPPAKPGDLGADGGPSGCCRGCKPRTRRRAFGTPGARCRGPSGECRGVDPGFRSRWCGRTGGWGMGGRTGNRARPSDLRLGMARDARNRAAVAQAQNRYRALHVEVATAARLASARLDKALHTVRFYQNAALPLRLRMLDQTQRQYNAMQVGLFDLLAAKRAQLAVGQAYIVALRDYWIARYAVDQLLAGRLPSVGPDSTSPMTVTAIGTEGVRH